MSKKILIVAMLLLAFSLPISHRRPSVACAADEGNPLKSEAERNGQGERAVDPHAAYMRFHFQDLEMDFVFGSMVLGATMNHGCEIGEAYATAAGIKDGDAASWQEQWTNMARRVEARGEHSLVGGHQVSAREQLQRASYYYRAALISMLPNDPRFKTTAMKSRALLKEAGKLFDPPLETIEIPFEGRMLPGYFREATPGKTPSKTLSKTLSMVGGSETFAEDLFFYIGLQTFDRGYNFLTVDLPGQGMLPMEGKFFRRDMNVPMKAVVDYALSRPEVVTGGLPSTGTAPAGLSYPRPPCTTQGSPLLP